MSGSVKFVVYLTCKFCPFKIYLFIKKKNSCAYMGAFPENWFWGTTKTSFYVYITSNFFVGSFHIDFEAMYIYLLVC